MNCSSSPSLLCHIFFSAAKSFQISDTFPVPEKLHKREKIMSMQKRALDSTSPGQASQLKRPRTARMNQVWQQSERNHVPRSWLTEEDVRRVVREELERANSHSTEYCQSCTRQWHGLEDLVCSLQNAVQKLEEAVEPANSRSPHLRRDNANSMAKSDARNLHLQLKNKLSLPIFTGKKLERKEGARISVALIDANTGDVVTSGLESSIKLDVVVLEGDFNKDDEDNWSQKEFENYVVKEREGKRPLLAGNLLVTLKRGVGELGDLIFTDNSSWNRSKMFRIGLKVASGYCGNTRIREAKTDAFAVKEHSGESYKKNYPPESDDEVWRLEKIAKDGKSHKKLSEAGIHKVEDFLMQLFTDSDKLREILGKSIIPKNWDCLIRHARTCKISWKLYLYYLDSMRKHGALFDADGQLIGLIKDRVYVATHRLSAQEKEHGDTIIKKAHNNLNDVREFNGETFSGSMQKKSSISFPSPVFEGQIEYITPVQCNLGPPICAAPGGPEATLENVGLTAKGHSGITALALPLRSQSSNFGNAVELSVDESVRLTAHRPRSADCLNVPISPADNVITTVRTPIQSHNVNLQNAMHGQMIDYSSQMDHAVNELVIPSEPPYASSSSFPYSSTLPPPEGNHMKEDFKSSASDDSWDCLLSLFQTLPDDDMSFQSPPCDDGSVRGTSKGVNGWLKIKAVLQWGFFIRKRRVSIVQLDEPPTEVQA